MELNIGTRTTWNVSKCIHSHTSAKFCCSGLGKEYWVQFILSTAFPMRYELLTLVSEEIFLLNKKKLCFVKRMLPNTVCAKQAVDFIVILRSQQKNI